MDDSRTTTEHHTLTRPDGARLAVALSGAPDAPALLLLNSLGTDIGLWAPQLDALEQGHRLIRLDTRGHGASSAPAGPYDIAMLGQDALAALDALGLTRVAITGISLGGMVAQWLAIHAPARVGRLVLANTAAVLGPAAFWQGRIDAVRQGGMEAVAETVLDRWFTAPFHRAQPRAIEPVRRMLLATAPEGYVGCCAAIAAMDQRADLPAIAAPTLVIGGTDDPATPPDSVAALSVGIRGARLAMLPGAHLPNIESAAAFTALLVEFLGEGAKGSG